jgi:Protein of unknown function (DUF5132)
MNFSRAARFAWLAKTEEGKMAGIDDLFKNGLGAGLAVAVGVAVLGPIVAPALGRAIRPLVKGAIKGGIVAYGWGRESFAEMQEYMEDTYAEAQSEMEHTDEVGKAAARSRGRSRRNEESAQPT